MFKFILLSFFILGHSIAGNGSHGGDVVDCKSRIDLNNFEGKYTLDFLLTETEPNPEHVINLDTVKEYIEYFKTLLNEKSPEMAIDFNDFSKTLPIEGLSLFSSRFVWQRGTGDLLNIPDENMERILPANCKFKSQAVVKENNIYYYDANIFRSLPVDNPRQFSYLMIHEWLRNYIYDSQLIRLVNSFLHDKQTKNLSRNEFIHRFKVLSRNSTVSDVAKYHAFAVIDELLIQKDFDLVFNYVKADKSLLHYKDYLIVRSFISNEAWDKFEFVFDLLSDSEKVILFKEYFFKREFDVLSRIKTSINFDIFSAKDMAMSCIRDNLPSCIDVLSNSGLHLSEVILDFVPSYRGGNTYSDYKYEGLKVDHYAYGTFSLNNSKHVSVQNASLLVSAAIDGRVEIFKKLSMLIPSNQIVNVKYFKEHFKFITNCSGCNMTISTSEMNLSKILDLRIQSLKNISKKKDTSKATKEEILSWISDIESIKQML